MTLAHHLAFLRLTTILFVNVDHFGMTGTLGSMTIESDEFFTFLLPYVAVEVAKDVEKTRLEHLTYIRRLHFFYILTLQNLLDD